MYEKLRTVIFPVVSNRRVGAALLLLRLFVGIAFIQHGTGKLMDPSEFAGEFGIPVWLALATMLIQLIGGILLIVGALTPLAALGIAGTMFTATVFLIHRGEPFINPAGHSWENSAFYLMAGIAGTMITATIFLINCGEPFINPAGHSWENSAFYLMAGICLALSGAGSWSLDAWLFGRRSNNPAVDINRIARNATSR